MKTVVSLYDDIEVARAVVEELVDEGIKRDNISLVARDVEGTYGSYLESDYERAEAEEVGEAAAGGAVGGAVVGGLTGVLVGLGAFAIPGIGPVIAAGPIAAGLTGAAIGAAAGGVLSALVEWGIPEEEAEYYAEGIRRGGTLVAARVDDQRVDHVVDVMEAYDPVDIESRASYWRSEDDWTGYDQEADPYGPEEISEYRRRQQAWQRGMENDDIDFEAGRTTAMDEFESFEPRFRQHYDSALVTTGYTYNQYLPAYRYGYNLATDSRYRDRSWDEIATDARLGWEDYNEGTWEDFKDAVRHGWEQVKDAVGAGEYEFGVMDDDEYARHRPSYEEHYDEYYGESDYSYDSYDAAYRYGYSLATYPRYRDNDWSEVEMDARERWESDNEGAWEEFKDAVRHGWEEAKRAVS
ncbi:MAG TPA: general stress protein [Candidatus Sulfomarinibacteraceae bacterium]|nr:general stress protein [Candidatus Sulfomarinibacteraceae bacterium]